MRRESGRFAWLWLAVWLGAGIGALAIDDPRLRFPEHLLAMGAMGAAWLALLRAGADLPRRVLVAVVVAGLALRIGALLAAPAFSDDVFRYVYEGRVVWYRGLGFPFAHPPADAPALGVPIHLLDEAWLRINHPHITTIYPPLAQLVFAAAGGLGELFGTPLIWLKLWLVGADLGVWAIIAALLRHQHRPVALSLAWGLCPLIIFETAREGHADSLSALGLALGIYAFLSARPRLGYAGFAIAALAKLNGLIALVAAVRSTRRGLAVGLSMAALLAAPLFMAGAQAGVGLTEYATRWRSGDGVFSLVLAISEAILGGDWVRLTDSGLNLTKHALARGLTAMVGLAVGLAILRRPAPMESIPERAGMILLCLLLIAPTLHPWYVAWALPFAILDGFAGRRPILALALLAPLLHHPGWLELSSGEWTDLAWVRALVHVPVWALLVADLAPRFGLGYPSRACRSKKAS